MLDQCPAEICAHIFGFACRDAGYTGSSLSLVSRYIHEASKPAKLQSIALVGRPQILAFAQLLDRTPTHLRTTRYLFINGQESEAEMEIIVHAAYAGKSKAWTEFDVYKSSARDNVDPERLIQLEKEFERQQEEMSKCMDDFGREGANAVESILLNLGPTIEILDIALNEYSAKMLRNPISLPRLEDLTTRCGFPLRYHDSPVLKPSHSLRHLHVVESNEQWSWATLYFTNGISYFAPSLTHLRLSQLEQDEATITYLESAIGVSEPIATVPQLPLSLELVVIQPAVAPDPHIGCSCCDDTVTYHDLVKLARQLRDREDFRVVLLQADATFPTEDPYFQEWMDKAGGGACQWNTSNLDTTVPEVGDSVD
ncbi:hypothetical protein C8R47DRAFT_495629 [Mycena vitilis]|nr:hypothetical protein C8R47DRAFT_495629 [Mycena vitilis]